LEANSR
jgi:hypothetical protein